MGKTLVVRGQEGLEKAEHTEYLGSVISVQLSLRTFHCSCHFTSICKFLRWHLCLLLGCEPHKGRNCVRVGLQSVVSIPAHSSWSLNRKKLNSQSVNQSAEQTGNGHGSWEFTFGDTWASAQRGEVELGIRAAAHLDREEQEDLVRRGVSGLSQHFLAP